MPSVRRRRIPDAEWERHRIVIRRLYLDEDRNLEGDMGVIKHMKDVYDFDASHNQYETQFKKWGLRKNLTQKEWQMIDDYLTDRTELGSTTVVYFHGKRFKNEKVRKETARYRNQERSYDVRPGQLPDGIKVSKSVPEQSETGGSQLNAVNAPTSHDQMMALIQSSPRFPFPAQSTIRSSSAGNFNSENRAGSPASSLGHTGAVFISTPRLPSPIGFGNLWSPTWNSVSENQTLGYPSWAEGLEISDIAHRQPSSALTTTTDIMSDEFQMVHRAGSPASSLGHTGAVFISTPRLPSPIEVGNLWSPTWDSVSENQTLGYPSWAKDLEISDIAHRQPSSALTTTTDIMSDEFQMVPRILLPKGTLSLALDKAKPLFRDTQGLSMMTARPPSMSALTCRRQQQSLAAQDPRTAFVALTFHLLMNNFSVSQSHSDDQRAVFEQLPQVSGAQIQTLLNTIPQPYCKALEHNLMKLSVEYGATSIVKTLLRKTSKATAEIQILLEIACRHRHVDIVEILLGIVSNKAELKAGVYTALYQGGDKSTLSSSVYKMMGLFLQAGVTLPIEDLRFWSRWKDDAWVETLLECGQTTSTYACEEVMGSLLPAIQIRSDEEAVTAVKLYLGNGFRITTAADTHMLEECRKALDSSAFHGKFKVLLFLVNAGVVPDRSCLVSAVRGNRLDIIDHLLERGLSPNAATTSNSYPVFQFRPQRKDLALISTPSEIITTARNSLLEQFPPTPLAEAIRYGNKKVFDLFAQNGAIQDLLQPTKSSAESFNAALAAALEVGAIPIVTYLLTSSRWKQNDGIAPGCFEFALLGGHETIIDTLLQAGIKPRLSEVGKLLALNTTPQLVRLCLNMGTYCRSEDYAMLVAVTFGKLEVVQDLIASGASVNPCPGRGLSHRDRIDPPLGEALLNHDQQMIELLQNHGAQMFSPFNMDIQSCSALLKAVESGNKEMVHKILSLPGLQVSDLRGSLLEAVKKGFSMVSVFSDALAAAIPVQINTVCVEALCAALHKKRPDSRIVSLLSDFADVNFISGEQYELSPLGCAIKGRHSQIIEDLIQSGGDVNGTVRLDGYFRGVGRRTALLQAIQTGDLNVVKQIVKAGARVNCEPTFGILRTPLQLAAEESYLEIVEFLVSQGAEVNATPCIYGGGTALQLAAIKGWVGIAEFLVGKGADANAPRGTYQGRTAFEGAAEWGRLDMLHFLFNVGVDLVSEEGREQVQRAVELAEQNHQPAAKELVRQLANEAVRDISLLGGTASWSSGLQQTLL